MITLQLLAPALGIILHVLSIFMRSTLRSIPGLRLGRRSSTGSRMLSGPKIEYPTALIGRNQTG